MTHAPSCAPSLAPQRFMDHMEDLLELEPSEGNMMRPSPTRTPHSHSAALNI